MPRRRTDPALEAFHPLVRQWFAGSLGTPSDPQRKGWPAIARGEHTLILAPTGTGKTLTAFLWELNALIAEGIDAPLANAVHLLYISPLKALNNDIERNLQRPLAELKARFEQAGTPFPELRVAVRTGDTPSAARARMLRKAPHILITTPESLHILLTSVKARGMFSALRAVIVDEIHAVAGTKRGAHLALTLERLERECARPPQRIGLSATVKPAEEVGRFLAPVGCTIVDCGLSKPMELRIVSPVEDLGDVGGSVWPSVAPLVLRHIESARTTLVFVNNRAQAERIAARVNALAEVEIAQPYHGSLSRERRFMLEGRLKAGELRALVTTSSLELGIDIGSVDLVLQLQSPKRVAAGLQRVGRAGHTLQAVSRGVFVPTFLDDAAETVAVVDAMRAGDVEPIGVVHNALDVLAQVIVAAVSVDDWTSAELYEMVRRAHPYHRLTRSAFDEVLAMLAGKYPADVAAELAPRLTWDRTTDRVTGSRASRLMAVVSGGTIPDRGLYTVNLPDRTRLGELDEEFVHESRVGDVFQLGSSTWRIASIEHDRVIVTPAPGAPARMPFWHGEYSARSAHLSRRIGELRRELASVDPEDADAVGAMAKRHASDEATITSLIHYVREQRASTATVPDDHTLVIEHFRDETRSVRLVLHAPFGGRVNAPWGMALAHRVREHLGPIDMQVQTTDDGIMLRLPDLGGAPPAHLLLGLAPQEAEQRVLEEVGASPLFGARFRMNAARALLLPRGSPRRRMPLWLQRLKALDLLEAVREYPSFPILVETYRDVLQDAFDMPALAAVLRALEAGEITTRVVEVDRPSPFSASLQFGFVMDWLYVDDTPRAERRAALLSLDRALLDELVGSEGADDETMAALREIVAERRGTVGHARGPDGERLPGGRARSADELAVLLDRAGDLTRDELRERVSAPSLWERGDPLEALLDSGRAVAVDVPTMDGTERRMILAESFPRYLSAFGEEAMSRVYIGSSLDARAVTDAIPAPLRHATLTPPAARREMLARFLALSGPVSVDEIRGRYAFDAAWVERVLGEWERTGKLVRGIFGERDVTRWCSRRLLEHARRRALAAARKAVEAVPLATFVAFLQRWQHVDPRDRLEGSQGVSVALRQLLGLARRAEGWERDYLPTRVDRYDGSALSHLGATGEMVWIGEGTYDPATGVRSLTGVRFVERGTLRRWIAGDASAADGGSHGHARRTRDGGAQSRDGGAGARDPGGAASSDDGVVSTLSEPARRIYDTLAAHGASFLADLRAATGLTTHALHDGLQELVAAGLVTNDTIDALRAVIHHRPVVPPQQRNAPDPTRWLPADFVASRPVVQRRPNLRRLPKWRRPDLPGPGSEGWVGRWGLVRVPGTLGPPEDEAARAEAVARQWLERYGVVTREWWRRERPPVSWRAIYHELKRLEMRGEVRRGYFVRGFSGAQFALPQAVEQLRAAASDDDAPLVVMAASDPANAYAVVPATPVPGTEARPDVDPLARPRGRGAVLVTRRGRVVLAAEGRGRRITVGADASSDDVRASAAAFAAHVMTPRGGARPRDLNVETIDGVAAMRSARVNDFLAAGYRVAGRGLVIYAPVGGR